MYTDDDLNAAIAAGVLPEPVAVSFRAFVAQQRSGERADDEQFRLLTGFNDIFVSIAAALALIAIQILARQIDARIAAVALAGCAWLLAEEFTRKRRMALPSIVLFGAFASAVYSAVSALIAPVIGHPAKPDVLMVALSCAATSAAGWVHWRRFHVPIAVCATVAAALAALMAFVVLVIPDLAQHPLALIFVAGAALIGCGIWWDASDRERVTRRADAAFWLHLAAAPLLVHPLFASLGLVAFVSRTQPDVGHAFAGLGIYLVLAVAAMVVDRRALLVSGLVYALAAIATLVKATGTVSSAFALTGVMLGGGLLLLSIWWHPMRARIMRVLPSDVAARLPVA